MVGSQAVSPSTVGTVSALVFLPSSEAFSCGWACSSHGPHCLMELWQCLRVAASCTGAGRSQAEADPQCPASPEHPWPLFLPSPCPFCLGVTLGMCSAGLAKQGTAWAAEEMGSQLGPRLLLVLPKKSSRKLVSYEL